MNKIHELVKKEETDKIEKQLEKIENTKNDSTRMFQAIKQMNRLKPKSPLLIQNDKGLTANEVEETKIIASFFKEQFFKNLHSLPDIPPSEMKLPFSKNEIQTAINSLRNNRSTGNDNVKAELLKYGPDIIAEEISIIFNEIAKTGEYPKELVQGILNPIQKPGKTKGPVGNLRPIILLSMVRKGPVGNLRPIILLFMIRKGPAGNLRPIIVRSMIRKGPVGNLRPIILLSLIRKGPAGNLRPIILRSMIRKGPADNL